MTDGDLDPTDELPKRLHAQNVAKAAATTPSDAERVRRALSALIEAREALSDGAEGEARGALNDSATELFDLLADWAEEASDDD